MTAADVVAVTFDSESFIEPWSRAIRAADDVERIFVVDNASRDGTTSLIQSSLPGATLLRNSSNEGFGRAANRGIAAGDSPYVFVCNVDVEIAPDFISRLVALLENDPTCGSACGKLRLDAERIDSTGLQPYAPRLFADRGHGEFDDGRFDQAGEVFGASGAAVLYRRAMLEKIRVGGAVFDPDYFLYWEDIDLAWRARLAGWSARYEPSAIAGHRRGSATGRSATNIGAYSFAHRLFTIDKNDDLSAAPRGQVHVATALLAAGLARRPVQWAAARRLLARRRSVALKRREVQALRTVSAPEIESWFAPLSLGHWTLERLRLH